MSDAGFDWLYTATIALAFGISWILIHRFDGDKYRAVEKHLTESERRELKERQTVFALRCFVLLGMPFVIFSEYVVGKYLKHSILLSILGMGGTMVIILGAAYRLGRPIRRFYFEMRGKYCSEEKVIEERVIKGTGGLCRKPGRPR